MKAFDKLNEVCRTNIDRKISPDLRPQALERLSQEMEMVQDKGLATLFLDLQDFINKIGIKTWEMWGQDCWTRSSLVAFLLDISELDPLSLHIPIEFLDTNINKSLERRESIVDFSIPFHYMKELDADSDIHRLGFMPAWGTSRHNPDAPIRIRYTCGMKQNINFNEDLEKIFQLAKYTGVEPDEFSASEKAVFSEMKKLLSIDAEKFLQEGLDGHSGELYCDPHIIDEYQPANVFEFGKLIGLVFNKPLWKANEQIIHNKGKLKDLITSPEDIYDICQRYGIDNTDCYLIAHETDYWVWQWGDIPKCKKYDEMMRHAGMPESYIHAIENAENIRPRSKDTKKALIQYRLAWYKVHFGDEDCEVNKCR